MQKGLTASQMIWIIAAVIAVAAILYILWSQGLLPFESSSREARCRAYFIRCCSEDNCFQDMGMTTYCRSIAENINGFDSCLNSGECEEFCQNAVS